MNIRFLLLFVHILVLCGMSIIDSVPSNIDIDSCKFDDTVTRDLYEMLSARFPDKYLPVVLAGTNWNYRIATLNWIRRMELMKVSYIILCFDDTSCSYIGAKRALKVTSFHRCTDKDKNTTSYSSTGAASSDNFLSMISAQRQLLVNSREVNVPPVLRRKRNTGTRTERQLPRNSAIIRDLERKKKGTIKQAGRRHRFKDMMSAKYIAIRTVLSTNRTVIWSDIDAMWLKPCAWSFFANAPPDIDIIAQRGLSPTVVSNITGVAVCTGFMMIRPTDRAKFLISTVLYHAVNSRMGDQFPMNLALYKFGGFSRTGVSPTLSYRSSNGGDVIDIANLSDDGNITVGLLPYRQFPRGMESGEGGSKNGMKLRASSFSSVSEVAGTVTSEEWSEVSQSACIWHQQADKRGSSKIAAMQRDDVLVLDPMWLSRIDQLSAEEVQAVLYSDPQA